MAKRRRNGLDSEDVVTMSTLRELLDDQKKEFTSLMELQQKNFNSFIETVMVTTNRRLDDIVRDVQDVKGSLQYSQRETGGVDASYQEQEQRISDIESKIEQLRSDMDCSILQLFVRGLQGKTTVVRIHKDATVDELYRKMSKKTKIPPERLRILYGCKQLQYGIGQHLFDYDVKHESTLFVVPRMGGPHDCSEFRTVTASAT